MCMPSSTQLSFLPYYQETWDLDRAMALTTGTIDISGLGGTFVQIGGARRTDAQLLDTPPPLYLTAS
jgi:hypothetical protein